MGHGGKNGNGNVKVCGLKKMNGTLGCSCRLPVKLQLFMLTCVMHVRHTGFDVTHRSLTGIKAFNGI